MGGTKENFQHLENVQSSSLSEDKSLEAGGGVVEGGHQLEHINTVQNEVNFRFVMTMLGFSITFVVAEVIPLFLITLFTVIAFDLNASSYSIWMLNSQVIAVGAIAPFVGRLSDLLGRKNITLLSLSLTIIGMITLGTAKTITAALAAQCISGTAIGMQLLTTISAVTELVPTSRRGITIGYIVIGFMPFAPGSLYGQQLATHSWRWVCVFVGVMAVTAFIIIAIFYNPPPRPNAEGLTKRQILARIDYLGGFLSISGVVLFLVGINWGGEAYAWSDRHVIATLTVGLFLIVCFWAWEYFGAPYPMFPASLATHKKMFTAVLLLCLTSGINYIPGIVFWVIQVYTVYEASYAQAGVYLLPIGFCIAGGAIISAVLMTVFKRHIHWILLGFCIMQTAGLGCMAAADPENINTMWAPLIFGLLGVGGVLLPSQVVFSIIAPPEHIGASVALSIVVRSIGQVIGTSMFYNIFKQNVTKSVYNHVQDFLVPAVGLVGANEAAITALVTALTAGPFDVYAHLFNATTPAQIESIVKGGHEVYKGCFGELYLISIAFGGAAILCFFFLADIRKFMNEHVAVNLA